MCSLCGVLGGRIHWSEAASAPEAFVSRKDPVTRRRERQNRTRIANAVLEEYGLVLSEWAGPSYVLASRTGRTTLVDNLTELWAAAEKLARRPCDPLDDRLIAALERRGGG